MVALRGAAAAAALAAASPTADAASTSAAREHCLDVLSRALRDTARRGRVLVLSGAGVSTDSGVPDYRGPRGTYTLRPGHRPITLAELMHSPRVRMRYWARSYFGLSAMRPEPNAAHEAIAHLQRSGIVREDWHITQNVDSLHLRARMKILYGIDSIKFQVSASVEDAWREYIAYRSFLQQPHSAHELELHGSLREVVCMSCGGLYDGGRFVYQHALTGLNEELYGPNVEKLRSRVIDTSGGFITNADGDAESEALNKGIVFRYPVCTTCVPDSAAAYEPPQHLRAARPRTVPQDGPYKIRMAGISNAHLGIFKPSVVFFGENLHTINRLRSVELAENCDVLLVLGSSVQTFSAYRLLLAAKAKGTPIYILNQGPTRGDEICTNKWELGLSDVLPTLVEAL